MLFDFRKTAMENVAQLLNTVNPLGLTEEDISLIRIAVLSNSGTSVENKVDQLILRATVASKILIADNKDAVVRLKRWNANVLYRQAGIASLRAENISTYASNEALLEDIRKTTGIVLDRFWSVNVVKLPDYLNVTISYSVSHHPAMYGDANFIVIQKDDVRDSLPFVYDEKNVDGSAGFTGAEVISVARAGKSAEQILEETGISSNA